MVTSTPLMGERSSAGRAGFALLWWPIMRANFFLCPLTQSHIPFFGGWHIWLSNLLFLWLTVGRGWWVIFMTKGLLFAIPFQWGDEKQRHRNIQWTQHSFPGIFSFWAFPVIKIAPPLKSTHFWRIFMSIYIYIHTYTILVLFLQNKHRYFSQSAGKIFQFESLPKRISKMNWTDWTQVSTTDSPYQSKQIQLRFESYKCEPTSSYCSEIGNHCLHYIKDYFSLAQNCLPKVTRIFWQGQ